MKALNKKELSERDICSKYITPALVNKAGWDLHVQIREEVSFTNGRVHVRGQIAERGQKKRADYILYYKPGIPIAVIEAKDNKHSVGAGMQQALEYAEILDLPFAYSSNGDAFVEHDFTITAGIIVFCEDIDHAERMRSALINENVDLVSKNRKYVMRITGDDKEGKLELDNFILPESQYPVIVTTSKLMTTGVDAQTCKLIILDRNIGSMTEFKQIIGRGTRINEEFDKRYFTIIDFKGATRLFADPKFNGDPVQVYEPKVGDSLVPPENRRGKVGSTSGKYTVSNVEVAIKTERTQYYDKNGNLITESIKDYSCKIVRQKFANLNDFVDYWNIAERKGAVIQELLDQGMLLDALAQEIGKGYDSFDLICYVAFDKPLVDRSERALRVRASEYLSKYSDKVKKVLNALLDKYVDEGVESIEDINVLKVKPISDFGTALEIVKLFGNKQKYEEALRELKARIFDPPQPPLNKGWL